MALAATFPGHYFVPPVFRPILPLPTGRPKSCFGLTLHPLMSENVISVGIASYGMSGSVFHAPLLAAHPGFTLKKMLERSAEKSKARYPQVEVVRDYGDLLQDEEIRLVVVNTPNALHYEMARQALEAGKHVVLEKPFTVTAAEGEELTQLAKEQNLILSAFQNRRWDGDFRTVQQVVESGWLGELVEFEGHYDRFRNYIEANTWKEETGPGSGILYNLGSHMIDQALVLFGLPQAVTADIRTQRPGGQVEDAYDLLLEYGKLKVVLKSSYLVREPGPRYTLHGTEGSFIKHGLDPQEDALKAGGTFTDPGWGREPEKDWGLLNTQLDGLHLRGTVETLPGTYQAFYQNIYDAIQGRAGLAVTAEQATNVIRIIEAAMQSNEEKRRVEV
jgi:scyllo-inositol 2-dehydrogenase (NADP+)